MSKISTLMSQILSKNRFWITWILAVTLIFFVHCLTLTISPTVWQDEVQIIEYGRLVLERNTDYSINWLTSQNKPLFPLCYLGPLIQELAFKITNLSIIGTRILSLLGAIVASTNLLGWLLASQINKKISFILAIIFLLDPMFVQSYKGDRIESYVFALCFGACWILKTVQNDIENNTNQKNHIFLCILAGSLTSMAFFIWPSAVILYPLIFFQFLNLIFSIHNLPHKRNLIIATICAGIMTAILLIIPIYTEIINAVLNTKNFTKNTAGGLTNFTDIKAWLVVFTLSPFLPLIALFSLIYNKQKLLGSMTIFAVTLVLVTQVYLFRAIYLLPYIIYIVSLLYQNSPKLQSNKINSRLKNSFLIIALIWCISLSIFVRPITALSQKTGRNPDLLVNAARSSIGTGQKRVLLGVYEFYYPGRILGWKTFKSMYDGFDEKDMQSFEYIIFRKDTAKAYIDYAEKSGFQYQQTLLENNQIQSQIKSATPYGPYLLYHKNL